MLHERIRYLQHSSQALRDNPLGDPSERFLTIYLPPNYDESPDRRYPVVWVLAPFTSWGQRFLNQQAWDPNIVQRMDQLVGRGEAEPAILAFPDAFTMLGGSQYVNSNATGAYEDYVIRELVPFLDDQFRTLPERDNRAVMGYSSGGYGALMLAMRHPDVFAAAASHSGDMLFEACYWPDIPGALRELERTGGVEGFLSELGDLSNPREQGHDWFNALNMLAMSACYSPNPASPGGFDLPFEPYTGAIRGDVWAHWQEKDPVRAAPRHQDALNSLRTLYFDCGRHDEYNLFLGARSLHQWLENAGIPHQYDEHTGGHRNVNWRYETSLPTLTRSIAPAHD